MLNFICGAKGSGKSSLIYKRIAEDLSKYRKVLLLVPEQITVEAESCAAMAARNVPVINLEVSSFKRLCNTVFRKYGGLSYNYVDKGARVLVMWQVLSTLLPFLKEYGKGGVSELDLSKYMLAAVNEFRYEGIRPEQLSEYCNKIEESGLKRKLEDLSLIFSTYEAQLKHMNYQDSSDDLTKLAECLETHHYFNDYYVYIDSFYGFTAQEYAIIDKIMRDAKEVSVSLCSDCDKERLIFSGTEKTEKELVALAKKNGVEISDKMLLSKTYITETEELRFLENNMWENVDEAYSGETDNIKIIECENEYAEAEMIACDISEKLRQGARYRDFVIIARNADDYVGITDTELKRFGIPCFVSQKDELKAKPLSKLISAALRICERGFLKDDVITFLKTGLLNIDLEAVDTIESYIRFWNINGIKYYDGIEWNMNPDGYTDKVSKKGSYILSSVNKTKALFAPALIKLYEKLSGRKTVNEITKALYEYLLEIRADKKSVCSEDGESIWNCLIGVFDSMTNVIGETKLDCGTYLTLFNMLVDQCEIGRIPKAVDEVLIGSADSIRTPYVKTVYIIGVNEGVFPGKVSESGIFSGAEREKLEKLGMPPAKSAEEQSIDERLYFYNAACCARDNVIISYCAKKISGEALKPSSAVEWIKDAFSIKPIMYSSVEVKDKIWNYDTSLDYAVKYPNSDIGKALKEIYVSNHVYSDRLERLGMSLTTDEESVNTETSEKIFGNDITVSPSRLEKYALCKFSYYCKYVLKLEENERISLKPTDVGTYMHYILEKFLSKISESKDEDPFAREYSDKEIYEITDDLTNEYFQSICSSEKVRTKRLSSEFSKLKHAATLAVKDILNEFRGSKFRPSRFEQGIDGNENSISPLIIDAGEGRTLKIQGIIDRVDTYDKGNETFVRVVDYKTGGKKFRIEDTEKGINLQMLMYLYSICEDPDKKLLRLINTDFENTLVPAGIIYTQAKPNMPKSGISNELENPEQMARSELDRDGLLIDEQDILDAMYSGDDESAKHYLPKGKGNSKRINRDDFAKLLDNLKTVLSNICKDMGNGIADAEPLMDSNHNACEYCEMKALCRKDSYNKKPSDNGDGE